MSMFEVSVSILGTEFEGSIHAIETISNEAVHYGCLSLSYVYVYISVCVHAQSCLILWDALDCSRQAPLSMGFSRQEHEWVAMPSSRGSFRCRDGTHVSCISGEFFTAEPPRKHIPEITSLQFQPKTLLPRISHETRLSDPWRIIQPQGSGVSDKIL